MEVMIDLDGLTTKEDVLAKFGEVFEFGGPDGNHPPAAKDGWGLNWDAFKDSMMSLADGGIWGNSRKFAFPLTITIHNYAGLERKNPEGLATLRDILASTAADYAERGQRLRVAFLPALPA